MQIIEAINGIDTLKPNTYTQEQKVKWLGTMDGIVKAQVLDTHEGEPIEFNGYEDAPLTTELLIPAPHEEVYIHYLAMKIDFANGEYNKYNNTAQMYNTAFNEYKKWYNREHMPKSVASLVFGG